MPDRAVLAALQPFARRFRRARVASALVAGAAAAGLSAGAATVATMPPWTARAIAFAALVATAGAFIAWTRGRSSPLPVARAVEARSPGSHNVVITAVEIALGNLAPPHPSVAAALRAAALRHLDQASPQAVSPLAMVSTLAVSSVLAVGVLIAVMPQRLAIPRATIAPPAGAVSVLEAGDLRVVVTPPAYSGRPPSEAINPAEVAVLEGSRIRLELPAVRGTVRLVAPGLPDELTEVRDGLAFIELVAAESRPLVLRSEDASGGTADRLVYLKVSPDERPVVRITRPARDLVFPAPGGRVPVAIDARDDVGLGSLRLRYTHVAGSGESFAFEEGEWPIEITRTSTGAWEARAVLSLDELKLQDGDALVYRAVATDRKPGAEPAVSDSFLIEVGRLAGVSTSGFALPEERDRHGISQQMLIIKTERLHAARDTMAADAFVEQARLLAVEQRMVKAEFVFMTGGEVADEVAEAEHSHELAEGRLENAAQRELLDAIRQMSRAEARLNDGQTGPALAFERAALQALQRAFDRRRYLLRTLPERNRIDVTRRLSGDLTGAQSSTPAPPAAEDDAFVAAARALVRELGSGRDSTDLAVLAARLIAIAPRSEPLTAAALRLSAAADGAARAEAARAAQQILIEAIAERRARPLTRSIERQPLAGRVADELSGRRRQP